MRGLNLYPVTIKRRKYSSYKGEVGKNTPNRLKRRFNVKEPDKV